MPMKMLQLNQHLPAILGLRLRGTKTNPLITGLACGGMGSTGPGRTLSNICSAISTSTSAVPPGVLRGGVLGCQGVRLVHTHTHTVSGHTRMLCTGTQVYDTHTHHVHRHTHRVQMDAHTPCMDGHTHMQAQTIPGAELGAWEEILRERNTEVKVTQSRLTLCDPMDSTVPGILQARILEWVAFPFSKRSSQPRDRTQVPGFCQTLSEDGIGVRGQSPQMSPRSAW